MSTTIVCCNTRRYHGLMAVSYTHLDVYKRQVQGVDVWLNTPTRPLEASGTSGEKLSLIHI